MRDLLAAVAFILISMAVVSFPQAQELEREKAYWAETFAGFKGISFRCTTIPEGQFEKELCSAITTDARFLAASSKTKIVIENYYLKQLIQSYDFDLLKLTLRIFATTQPAQNFAIFVELAATKHYSRAVEAEMNEGTDAIPRPGELQIWNRDFIAAGSQNEEMKAAIVSHSGTLLRTFFTNYLEAQEN